MLCIAVSSANVSDVVLSMSNVYIKLVPELFLQVPQQVIKWFIIAENL